jgi:hypothetical protein
MAGGSLNGCKTKSPCLQQLSNLRLLALESESSSTQCRASQSSHLAVICRRECGATVHGPVAGTKAAGSRVVDCTGGLRAVGSGFGGWIGGSR